MPENIFSKRLQERRDALELSQEGLAKKAKLQATAISHFETGSRKPSFDNLRNLADALETTVDYLMGRTDSHRVVLAAGDKLYRDYEKLSERDRETARAMMASLARRAEKEHEN